MLYRKGYKAGTLVICAILAMCCTHSSRLDYALDSAGSNRTELESVLDHYRTVDANPQKLRAAEFLIENLPAHYSYAGAEIYEYYDYAARILADTGHPEPAGWQIVDFGRIRHGRACFHDMGREVLYMAMGYDGEKLIPVTAPFILHKDRTIEYVSADTIQSPALDRWKNNAL